MINLRQVKSFLTVVEAGTVTAAAQTLCLTPSSVSAQLRELATEVGVELFEPSGRGLVLSIAGQQLVPEFQQLLTASEDVVERARLFNSEPVGELRLYAPSSMCIYRLPLLIERLQKNAPEVELHLQHDPFDYRQALKQRDIEAAIVVVDENDPEFNHQPIWEEEVLYVTHPLNRVKKTLTPLQLTEQTLITTEPGCSYRVAAENHLAKHSLSLKPKQNFSNVEVIRRCLLSKMGIGLLPRCVVQEDIDQKRLVAQPVEGAPYRFHSTIIWPKLSRISPRLQALIEVIKSC